MTMEEIKLHLRTMIEVEQARAAGAFAMNGATAHVRTKETP